MKIGNDELEQSKLMDAIIKHSEDKESKALLQRFYEELEPSKSLNYFDNAFFKVCTVIGLVIVFGGTWFVLQENNCKVENFVPRNIHSLPTHP